MGMWELSHIPIIHGYGFFYKTEELLLQLFQGGQDLLGQGRDAGHAGAGGIVDGVQDGGVRSIQRGLAAAGGTVGAVGTVGLVVVQLDVIGNIVGVRDAALEQAGVLVQILEVLGQSKADALGQAAVEVAVHQELVHDGADVGHAGELDDLDLAGLGVDLDLGQEDGVHVGGKGLALGGVLIHRVVGAVGGDPVAPSAARRQALPDMT